VLAEEIVTAPKIAGQSTYLVSCSATTVGLSKGVNVIGDLNVREGKGEG
jgi:hypothetical protein